MSITAIIDKQPFQRSGAENSVLKKDNVHLTTAVLTMQTFLNAFFRCLLFKHFAKSAGS